MTYSNVKPHSQDLLETIDQYTLEASCSFSCEYKDYLKSICVVIDSICRKALTIAMAEVSKKTQTSTIFSFSPSTDFSPFAAKIADDAYRISMPIGLIQRLLESAPNSHSPTIGIELGIRESSVIYASLTAFAHEMDHLFIGHLESTDTRAQEFDADLKAGMLIAVWAHDPKFKTRQWPAKNANIYLECLMGFIHLCSLFEATNGSAKGLYLPAKLRFFTMVDGFVSACDRPRGKENVQKEITYWLSNLPDYFGHNDSALTIRTLFENVSVGLSSAETNELETIDKERECEKKDWYPNSKYIRPIARQLNKIIRRK